MRSAITRHTVLTGAASAGCAAAIRAGVAGAAAAARASFAASATAAATWAAEIAPAGPEPRHPASAQAPPGGEPPRLRRRGREASRRAVAGAVARLHVGKHVGLLDLAAGRLDLGEIDAVLRGEPAGERRGLDGGPGRRGRRGPDGGCCA